MQRNENLESELLLTICIISAAAYTYNECGLAMWSWMTMWADRSLAINLTGWRPHCLSPAYNAVMHEIVLLKAFQFSAVFFGDNAAPPPLFMQLSLAAHWPLLGNSIQCANRSPTIFFITTNTSKLWVRRRYAKVWMVVDIWIAGQRKVAVSRFLDCDLHMRPFWSVFPISERMKAYRGLASAVLYSTVMLL